MRSRQAQLPSDIATTIIHAGDGSGTTQPAQRFMPGNGGAYPEPWTNSARALSASTVTTAHDSGSPRLGSTRRAETVVHR